MMDLVDRESPSLWWRLSWQLSLVVVAVLAIVITGLCVYGAMILSPNTALEDTVVSVIADAITGDPATEVNIKETAELLRLREQNRELWYVVATKSGVSTSYGIVPASYAELAGLVHLFDDADIRGAVGTNDIATIKSVATTVGEIRILFGGVADKGWPVVALLARSYPIYFSLLAIALPTIFLAVPHIVRHGLARVSDVAQMASKIDFRCQEARLPVDGIPREIAPLVVGFNGALERLESGFQRRRRFLIDAAHELRTPIAIMQTRIEGITDHRERRSLLDDVGRLAETAEQLLDFERNSQAIDQFEMVDLVSIVKGVVADLAPQAITAGYQISFQSDVVCLKCKCSPSALPRAVSNLVRNAIDHGGGEGMITVAVSAGGSIEVVDEGPGIPIEDQDLVFEPFYRVTPKSNGAGLGLSLVKQIVANHHGQVSLKSNPKGTRVTIQLQRN